MVYVQALNLNGFYGYPRDVPCEFSRVPYDELHVIPFGPALTFTMTWSSSLSCYLMLKSLQYCYIPCLEHNDYVPLRLHVHYWQTL